MIRAELYMLAASFVFGAGIIISYGLIDVLRRFFLLGKVTRTVTELIYWTGASVIAFMIQFRLNDGILRLYPVAGAAAGLLLFHMLTRKLFAYLAGKAGKIAVKRRIRRRKQKLVLQNRLKKQQERVRMKLESLRNAHGKEEKES